MPSVSVIVPIYNAQDTLDSALDSLHAQSLPDMQVILINDGSTDGSLRIAREHAKRDPRFVVVDKPNEGYGAGCNLGIDMAKGDWVAVFEPDDWIEGSMYAELLAYARSLPEAPEIVKSPYIRVTFAGTPSERRLQCSYRHRVNPPGPLFGAADAPHLLTHHPSIWSAIYSKRFLDERGIRFLPIPGAGWADNPFLFETLCRSERIAYLDRPFYCYREESAEQAASALRAHPLVPLQRWNDIADVLDSLDGPAEPVLVAAQRRLSTYIGNVLGCMGIDGAAGLRRLIVDSFGRVDMLRFLSDSHIPPARKRLLLALSVDPLAGREGHPSVEEAADATGVRVPGGGHMAFLASEFAYSVRNNGVAYAVGMLRGFGG